MSVRKRREINEGSTPALGVSLGLQGYPRDTPSLAFLGAFRAGVLRSGFIRVCV